jgi:peptidyl-prolyl cis-trans isomerase SurA
MKRPLYLLGLLLLLSGSASAKIVDRIVAQVNSDIITLSDIKREMRQIEKDLAARYSGEQLEEALKKAQEDVLEQLIRQRLLLQKAEEYGFGANVDLQVSAYLERIRKDNGLKDLNQLEQALATEGWTLATYREYIKKQMISQSLIQEFVSSRITLLTEEVEKYYRDHKQDFATPEEVTLSEIVIGSDGDPAQAEARANEVHRRISQGEAFATLASQYSKGPTASKGGSIGSYNPKQLNPELAKAIAGVKEGEITPVIPSSDSFSIYRVDQKKESVTPPLDEIRDKIKERLWEAKFQPEYQRYLNQLREEAYIQVFSEIKK